MRITITTQGLTLSAYNVDNDTGKSFRPNAMRLSECLFWGLPYDMEVIFLDDVYYNIQCTVAHYNHAAGKREHYFLLKYVNTLNL